LLDWSVFRNYLCCVRIIALQRFRKFNISWNFPEISGNFRKYWQNPRSYSVYYFLSNSLIFPGKLLKRVIFFWT